MNEMDEIKKLIDNMAKYDLPEKEKMWFDYFAFCMDHNKWIFLRKGYPIDGRIGHFTREYIIEPTDKIHGEHHKHITSNCTIITEQSAFIAVYDTLVMLFNRVDE